MSTKVKIKYNPYYVKTDIEINGHIQTAGSEYYEMSNGSKRLQDWIDEFLGKLVANASDLDFQIIFTGTALDGDDVTKAAKDCESLPQNQKNGVKVNVIVNAMSSREDKLSAMQSLYQEAQNSPIPDFVSEDIKNGFMRALGENFEITIIAPMSSGKSTVINALLGTDLLPSMNAACTATIARIENDPDKPVGEFVGRRFAKTDELLDNWTNVNEYRKDSRERLLRRWNADPKTGCIEITGHIPAFQAKRGTNYVFIDTPGPNSHGTNHREILLRALTGKIPSMVLYVFNAKNACTDDDHSLLEDVSHELEKNGRSARDRVIFIANQMDSVNPRKESHLETLERWKTYLEGTFGIMNPIIIPVAAEFAKFLRIEKNYGINAIDGYEQADYNGYKEKFSKFPELNMLQYVKGQINSSCFRELQRRLDVAPSLRHSLEIKTGIPVIEALLNDFLEKHVIASKLKDGVDCLQSVLDSSKIAESEEKLFKRRREELREASKRFADFLEKKKEADNGMGFRAQISKFTYRRSAETDKKLEQIHEEKISIQHELENLPDEMEESEAKDKYKSCMEKGKKLCDQIQTTLNESLSNDYHSVLRQWEADYNKYIKKLLESVWTRDDFPELKALQVATLEIPNITVLIETHGRSVERKRSITHRRKRTRADKFWGIFLLENPFRDYDISTSNGSYKTKVITRKSIIDEVIPKLEDFIDQCISNFDKQAGDNIRMAKEVLLAKMSAVDEKLEERNRVLKKAANDKRNAEEQEGLAKKRLEWLRDFEPRLKSILILEESKCQHI
ncbi:MAG: dynamin family protein [Victivallaceae bacterium]|nr:dynamin family protein [Victivallaceae bacterium]